MGHWGNEALRAPERIETARLVLTRPSAGDAQAMFETPFRGFAREGVWRRHSEFPNLAPGAPADVACYAAILGN